MFRVLSAGGAVVLAGAAFAAVQVVGPDAGKLLDAVAAAFEIMGTGNVTDQMFSLVQNASFHTIRFLVATRLIRMVVMPQTIEFRFELAAVETDIGAISLLFCLVVPIWRKMRVLVLVDVVGVGAIVNGHPGWSES